MGNFMASSPATPRLAAPWSAPECIGQGRIDTVHGDITTLGTVQCIVNAANETGLGCDIPNHCVDSAIHAAAGPRMRDECKMACSEIGGGLPVAHPILTKGYDLPCQWVLHVQGPRIRWPGDRERLDLLAKCYESCLAKCLWNNITSVAFCCISTGLYGYDKRRAAETAFQTVAMWQKKYPSYQGAKILTPNVVFVTFTEDDKRLYEAFVARHHSSAQAGA